MKKLRIRIQSRSKTTGSMKVIIIDASITHTDFDPHDTVGHLFAMEFACNNHSEIPMRVWIEERD